MPDVPRTPKQRLEQLRRSLVVIESNLDLAKETGEVAYLLPVAEQLRALLVSVGQRPLLLDLAKEFDFPIIFYGMRPGFLDSPEYQKMAQILGPVRMVFTPSTFGPEKNPPPEHHEISIREWLANKQADINGRTYTGEELIRMTVGKEVAHYDPSVPKELAEMNSLYISGFPSHFYLIAQLGSVVAHLGRKLLEHWEAKV